MARWLRHDVSGIKCYLYSTKVYSLSVDNTTALSDDDCAVNQKHLPDIKQRFGKAVRRRRRELDLSQEDLAERAELHRTYISNVERGELNPSLETMEKLVKALGITFSALFADYGIEVDE